MNSDRGRDLRRQVPCFARPECLKERMETFCVHPLTLIPQGDLFLVVSVEVGVKRAFPDPKFIFTLIRIILKSCFPTSALLKHLANCCGPDVRLCCREGKNGVI